MPSRGKYQYLTLESVDAAAPWLHQSSWQKLWSSLTEHTGGGLQAHWLPETFNRLLDAQRVALPPVRIIPAIREIGPKNQGFGDYSGQGLIDRLAELQSPDHDRRQDRERFERINLLLRAVTNHDSARIEIPHHRDHILVHMNDRILPLESLGTGIQEVIMIAAFCTLSDGEIVCIEEPELHLHPLLQRKLVEYLKLNTSNQYFIATHSPAFIDTPGAAIFHVQLVNNVSHIGRSVLRDERYQICIDLGHKASDLIQSNAVVWVEGPSDRIYIKHWLNVAAPDLIEGIHYSIMFYGGRLLSHLSANDAEVNDFIDLKTLNRNLAIVIDSDRSKPRDSINATKGRVVEELSAGRGVAWVTKGREIENYVPFDDLQAAVKEIYGDMYDGPESGGGIYEHALPFWRTRPKRTSTDFDATSLLKTDVDKVKVARRVCEYEPNLGVTDLEERLSELIEMIRRANH